MNDLIINHWLGRPGAGSALGYAGPPATSAVAALVLLLALAIAAGGTPTATVRASVAAAANAGNMTETVVALIS